jgi:hypothetical protein
MKTITATGPAVVPIHQLVLVVGSCALLIGLVAVVLPIAVYVQGHPFSFFTVFLSEIGATPVWPQVIVTSAGLVSGPVRYAFVVLLVLYFWSAGGGRFMGYSILALATVSLVGLIMLLSIPHTLDRDAHLASALTHFFAVVAVQAAILIEERRLRLSPILISATLAVIIFNLIFAVLLSLAGKVAFISRTTPALWEWLAFAAQFYWSLIHTIMLGRVGPSSSP